LRRGFKAEAEDYAREFRAELKIQPHMPLCPHKLANHLAIPVLKLSEFSTQAPEAVSQLRGKGKSAFSAITIFYTPHSRVIIHNDEHHPYRQTSNIAHELAHGILGHPQTPPLNEDGCRFYDKSVEDEATWLGATLLMPREAALHIVANGVEHSTACKDYKISNSLLLWRIRMTGVMTQLKRRRAAR
jgi:Zn-dependent peptidase ImmA (M78 family)